MTILTALITAGIVISTGTTKSQLSKLEWSNKNALKEGANRVSTYKGGKYCGPGWGFTYKDILDGTIKAMPAAIDAIDEACKAHDHCYEENGYATQGCNLVLTYDLVKIVTDEKSTSQQRTDAVIMAVIFFVESQTIDLGKLALDEVRSMKNRLLGNLKNSLNTVETEIKREMRLRGTFIP